MGNSTFTDPSLQPSWLMRHLPRILVLASFVTMAGLWVGVSWRLELSREAALVSGKEQVIASTESWRLSLATSLQMYEQAAKTASVMLKASDSSFRDFVATGAALNDPATVVLALDRQGQVLENSGLGRASIPAHWASLLQRSPSTVHVLPPAATATGQRIGLHYSLAVGRRATDLLFMVPVEKFTSQANAAMGSIWGTAQLNDTATEHSVLSWERGQAVRGAPVLRHSAALPGTSLNVAIETPIEWALQHHEAQTVPTSVAISVFLGLMAWGTFITAAIGFKRALSAQVELTKLVALDALTGLPNRRTFESLLAHGIAQTKRSKFSYGLLFIDLDNFKHVNDSLGHDAGDELLREVSRRLTGAVRETDYVCRLGGDEFVVLLPHLEQPEGAQDVAMRILSSLANPVCVSDVQLHVGASIGVAVAPRDAATATQLVACADMAVYRAKASGKGGFAFFDSSLKEKADTRTRIGQDIRQGVSQGQFYLVYQPTVNLNDRNVTGYEALLRWSHPVLGAVPPSEFIPIAEETGLIELLGNVAIEQAISQIRRWHDQGFGWTSVAVNLSERQLRSKLTAQFVKTMLELHAVPPECLQVEIAEAVLAEEEERTATTLGMLRDSGVRLVIDDFGTGHSSLTALQKYRVSTLKIDRKFVLTCTNDKAAMQVCQAIVHIAHSLSMRVIAEGVESAAQLDALRRLGCDEGQGYLLASPQRADELLGHVTPVLRAHAPAESK